MKVDFRLQRKGLSADHAKYVGGLRALQKHIIKSVQETQVLKLRQRLKYSI